MRHGDRILVVAVSLAIVCRAEPGFAVDYVTRTSLLDAEKEGAGSLSLDGEFVHNIGQLQVNITNWGLIGSHPGRGFRWSDAPSAMWPAGSGVEHLYAAGLWVGALRGGVPLVTTGQFEPEMRASPDDPLDTVWESYQGAENGRRYPDPLQDDDGDGLIDEDPLNGLDDDGDGKIDEDFAAIGSQMFRCVMRDNTARIVESLPDHEPLDLRVVQTSYAWASDDSDDFVGFDYEVTNIGLRALKGIYVGFFADPDVGERGTGDISTDDVPGWFKGTVRAADGTDVQVVIAYIYDDDGDNGAAESYFGIMFLDHPIDPRGVTAPPRVAITSFNAFAGTQPFALGGEPTNDAERYELLSTPGFDPSGSPDKANDFRLLLATGPFERLEEGETLKFSACMVAGRGRHGLLQHAADAALTYYGAFFDKDLDPGTGVEGRENQICAEDFGMGASNPNHPIYSLFTNPCDTLGLAAGEGSLAPTIKESDLDEEGCIYVNSDCYFELERRNGQNNCAREAALPEEALSGCTGVRGKEHQVRWLVGLAPVAPDMRIWQTDNRIHVFWNDMSRVVPDLRLQEVDFESFRIWRADGWERPFGSSVENGPEAALWSLIAEFDEVSYFRDRRTVDGETVEHELPLGKNTGLDVIRYVPAMLQEGTPEHTRTEAARDLVQRILEDPEYAYLSSMIDPAEVVRYLNHDGAVTPLGKKYPDLRDFEGSWDVVDTAYWGETGLGFYEYVDEDVFNGIAYFYSVTATDFLASISDGGLVPVGRGLSGDPQSNFHFAVPRFAAQTADERESEGQDIFAFPNPATREALADFSQFRPNDDDPTGVRIMFANLPAARNTIRIYTLAGDLIETIDHDGNRDCPGGDAFGDCGGSAFWNLMSRNGQEVVSGVYLFSVESADSRFDRVVGRFVVVR
jgi:hypothetical protein